MEINCAIHWKEIYPVNSAIRRLNNRGLMDSAIHLLNNQGQEGSPTFDKVSR